MMPVGLPVPVSLPSFMPASHAKLSDTKSQDNYAFVDGGDQIDFDLLAEYLLDEQGVDTGSSAFDFSTPSIGSDAQPVGVVSPEVESGLFADPLADNTFVIKPFKQIVPAIKAGEPKMQVHSDLSVANAPTHLAPAPPVLGMAMPPTLPGIAPMPAAQSGQTMIVHQHKRPRIHAPSTSVPSTQVRSVPMMSNIAVPQRGGRQKSQAQIDRRRERNRILARRTRLRKKFFFESLQKDVTDLQKENMALKEIVKSRMDAKIAKQVLDTCKANEELPSVVLEHCGDPSAMNGQDFNLMSSIKKSQQCFVITDPSLQDNPIVYASDDFLTLTGYTRDQVLGRNCRFLQGSETDKGKISSVSKAVNNGDDVTVTFINYMADGTPFWNKLFIAALRDAQNNIVNFIGVSVKVAGPDPSDHEFNKPLPGESITLDTAEDSLDYKEDITVDADAAVMAIEGAVTAAVAAGTPNVIVPRSS